MINNKLILMNNGKFLSKLLVKIFFYHEKEWENETNNG